MLENTNICYTLDLIYERLDLAVSSTTSPVLGSWWSRFVPPKNQCKLYQLLGEARTKSLLSLKK